MLTKFLLYKKPHLVNAAHTREDYYHKLHVMFAMFKVGRHDFLVRAPKLNYNRAKHQYEESENVLGEPDYYYYSNVSDIRPEDVHPFVKTMAKNTIVRYFDKEKSVFMPWKELSPQQTMQAFDNDIENTRLHKLIKNPEDVSRFTLLIVQSLDLCFCLAGQNCLSSA